MDNTFFISVGTFGSKLLTFLMVRFALEKTEDRKSVFSAGCYTVTAGGLLLSVAIALLPVRGVFDEYAEMIVCYTIASCYHSLCAQFIRAEGEIRLFAWQGVLNTAMVIGLNILFLAVFRLGITGYVKRSGVYDEIKRLLQAAGKEIVEFSGIMPNPIYDKVQEGVELARSYKIDLILAVGGGSVIDSCNIIQTNPRTLDHKEIYDILLEFCSFKY